MNLKMYFIALKLRKLCKNIIFVYLFFFNITIADLQIYHPVK